MGVDKMRIKKRIIRDPRPLRSTLVRLDGQLYMSRSGIVYINMGFDKYKKIGRLTKEEVRLVKETYGTYRGRKVRKKIAERILAKIKL